MKLGVDLTALDELDSLLRREWFRHFVFAEAELAHADGLAATRRAEFLVGRFSAKEAVLKVLGHGLFQGVVPHDIEVTRAAGGEPCVTLSGTASDAAARAGISGVSVSITHKRDLVAAVAVGW
ncbi:holo-ACP synthase [Lentzea sp. JNUCC 0626]|uniref:holo-ACP synthase n=1 Tax=Lentzea sp. JNUCC 0626 TaxID=3367513 RepID=UPI00374834B1